MVGRSRSVGPSFLDFQHSSPGLIPSKNRMANADDSETEDEKAPWYVPTR